MITSQNKTHLKKLISNSLIFIDLNYIYFLFVLVLWVTAIRDILCMSLFSLKGNKIIFWREYYNQENIYLQTRKKCSFFIVQIHNNYVRIICQKTNFQKKRCIFRYLFLLFLIGWMHQFWQYQDCINR